MDLWFGFLVLGVFGVTAVIAIAFIVIALFKERS